MERALVLVKPDGVERALIGAVIRRFEEAGLKVTALKMLKPTEKLVGLHYADDKEWLLSVGKKARQAAMDKGEKVSESEMEIGNRIRSLLIKELTKGVVVAFVLEGNSAAEVARKIAGSTEPRKADPSSIRGMYSGDSYSLADLKKRPVRNIVHVSENSDIAEKEIKVWFSGQEIMSYRRADEASMYG